MPAGTLRKHEAYSPTEGRRGKVSLIQTGASQPVATCTPPGHLAKSENIAGSVIRLLCNGHLVRGGQGAAEVLQSNVTMSASEGW
jgi:hypothetical protein